MRLTPFRPALASSLLVFLLGGWSCRSRVAPETMPAAEQPASPAIAPATTAAPRADSTPATAKNDAGSAPEPSVGSAWPTLGEAPPGVTRFAAIGDFGIVGEDEQAVAELVLRAKPEFVITLGDNNYPTGSADTIDVNIGRYYSSLIAPYKGHFGAGAKDNRFFPSLGNHDWMSDAARPYLDYFTLPGNERYYDVERGNVHLFSIDSDPHEPDGIDAGSVQARWLKGKSGASKSAFQIAYMHHPPYSSSQHGSSFVMQWPYRDWGVDLVLAGHDHTYERVEANGLVYVVNGLGGNMAYDFGVPLPGSKIRFNSAHGAMFFEVSKNELRGRFVTTRGTVIDTFSIAR
jgi:tartrate-resistant acid phosphatase type 5